MNYSRKAKDMTGLAAWLIVSFIPSLFGAFFTPGPWYADLNKPEWTPPGYIFGPVWTLLYTTMGISAWLVWKQKQIRPVRPALAWFVLQLLFNALWSWIFFGLHNPGLALIEIIILWISIIVTLFAFLRIHRPAGLLLMPYLLWVSFASVLNYSIWRLN